MSQRSNILALTLSSLLLLGCSSGSSSSQAALPSSGSSNSVTPGATASPTNNNPPTSNLPSNTGQIQVLTYNVAGLPQIVSKANPARNMPLISPKLNAFEIVLAQEDFSYHNELSKDTTHAFQSSPLSTHSTLVNDGLNRFSRTPFTNLERRKWNKCHGLFSNANDCLSSKGFSVARHEVDPGVFIDIYNLHADAGGDAGDVQARLSNFLQVAQYINTHSAGNAIIVAGDTNLGSSRQEDVNTFNFFLYITGLTDVARALNFPERIDRLMIRSSAKTVLTAKSYRVATELVDSNGKDLSDHEGLEALIDWTHTP